jgi:polar amino acid transport system ATP-binding protein
VGFVFQQFNLFPHLDVIGNVVEAPVRVLGEGRAAAVAEAVRLLDRVGLSDKTSVYPHQLSGGQQQRVAIARALAMRPEVLLLDEPTSALDPVMATEVMAVISELARAGQTMIVVTHQLGLVRAIADTVHVFAAGRRVEFGPTREVFENPSHETTRSFLRKLQAW